MSQQIVNKIRCEVAANSGSRWARFYYDETDSYLCHINQYANIAAMPFVMSECGLDWNHPPIGGAKIDDARLHAEVMRQAIELADKWNGDVGKPYKEVLSNETT